MNKEIWKPVVGYEGLYEVSNIGRVKSLPRKGTTKKEKILRQYNNGDNYIMVFLSKNDIRKKEKVHRLVASAFMPNPNNFPCVNHKDEDRQNNNIDNLEWCTYEYNLNYGTRIKKCSKPIVQLDIKGNLIRIWDSATKVMKELGYKNTVINNCLKGRLKTAYGYKWRYATLDKIKELEEGINGNKGTN